MFINSSVNVPLRSAFESSYRPASAVSRAIDSYILLYGARSASFSGQTAQWATVERVQELVFSSRLPARHRVVNILHWTERFLTFFNVPTGRSPLQRSSPRGKRAWEPLDCCPMNGDITDRDTLAWLEICYFFLVAAAAAERGGRWLAGWRGSSCVAGKSP